MMLGVEMVIDNGARVKKCVENEVTRKTKLYLIDEIFSGLHSSFLTKFPDFFKHGNV